MRLADVQKFIQERIGELIEKCISECRDAAPAAFYLQEGLVYEGCDRCIIRTALDSINVGGISVNGIEGFIEFIPLEDFVIVIGEETAEVVPYESLEEYIESLAEFGVIAGVSPEELIKEIRRHMKREGD